MVESQNTLERKMGHDSLIYNKRVHTLLENFKIQKPYTSLLIKKTSPLLDMFLIKNVMALICSRYFITSFPIYMACCCNLSIWQGTCSIFFVIYLILSWNKVLSITSTPLLVAKASLLLFNTRTMVSNYVYFNYYPLQVLSLDIKLRYFGVNLNFKTVTIVLTFLMLLLSAK
jgi:hypothetical protein